MTSDVTSDDLEIDKNCCLCCLQEVNFSKDRVTGQGFRQETGLVTGFYTGQYAESTEESVFYRLSPSLFRESQNLELKRGELS